MVTSTNPPQILLSQHDAIDATRIYLIGHSEGGIIAPRAAAHDPRVAGLVLLGGPAQRLDQVIREQIELILAAHGSTPQEIEAMARNQDIVLQMVAAGKDRDLPVSPFGERGGDWLRSHVACEPEATIRSLDLPILAIYGGADLQVPPTEAQVLEGWLHDGAHPATRVEVLEGMDHLLMPADALPGMGAYGDPDRELDPRLLTRVAHWLTERSREAEPVRSGR